jgi:hypothetical protein
LLKRYNFPQVSLTNPTAGARLRNLPSAVKKEGCEV